MATVRRLCALVIAAAGVVAAPPVDAAMTLVFRDGSGKTVTYYQEGDRVRLIGDDAGEAIVVDLATKRHLVVYDEVKAYAELLHLPPAVGLGVGVFATFAALKIAYGASIPRTFALFALSAVIAAVARYGVGHIGSLLGGR